MQMMIGEPVHNSGGKLMHDSLAKRGIVISYTEWQRFLFEMAAYTVKSHEAHVALPDHSNPSEFTRGTTDNWDREGATSEHDAVTVLFQNKPATKAGAKPKISETTIKRGLYLKPPETTKKLSTYLS